MRAGTPRWWAARETPPLAARLLSLPYAGLGALRRGMYRRGLLRAQRLPVPVMVVGNIVAGGAGKTPLTIALVRWLRAAGWTPGVASRGYGRVDSAPRFVEAGSLPQQVGDEPLLIARRSGARVRVDADRVAAARALIADGCDIIVCDDGLQHYRLARDLEIEVVDARRGYGNGWLLPAGPLREPLQRAAHCDFRVVNLGVATADADLDGRWPMVLQLGDVWPLSGGVPRPLARFAGQRVHAVAGLAEPARFFDTLRAAGLEVEEHPFPDHHPYTAADLQFASPLPVLMTEKDAMKCLRFAREGQFAVPVEAILPAEMLAQLQARLPARE